MSSSFLAKHAIENNLIINNLKQIMNENYKFKKEKSLVFKNSSY